MKEIEKKYLLGDKSILKEHKAKELLQGYLFVDQFKEVRIRLHTEEKKAVLGIKFKLDPEERDEYEYTIPYTEGLELYSNCTYKLKKYRISFDIPVDDEKVHIDIDTFDDNITIVEVELPYKGFIYIPYFCGIELSKNYRYTNYRYAGIEKF